MSMISCDMREGRTEKQKRALAAGLIAAVQAATGEPNCEISDGANWATRLTPEVEAKLMRDVLDSTHRAVGSDPAIINVVIHELAPSNVSVGGFVTGFFNGFVDVTED